MDGEPFLEGSLGIAKTEVEHILDHSRQIQFKSDSCEAAITRGTVLRQITIAGELLGGRSKIVAFQIDVDSAWDVGVEANHPFVGLRIDALGLATVVLELFQFFHLRVGRSWLAGAILCVEEAEIRADCFFPPALMPAAVLAALNFG